jgi:Uma2 family endonuclease
MVIRSPSANRHRSLGELIEDLGSISPDRIIFPPNPGFATEDDVLWLHRSEKRLCELVDGVLVEKSMGFRESCLAGLILSLLREFVMPRNLGLVTGPDGMMRLAPGLVRIPDVSFISWERIPSRRMPKEPVTGLAPDLAVEVLSEGNTPAEMNRKIADYFRAGVQLVWLVDPEERRVHVYTSPDQPRSLAESEILPCEPVLQGFSIPLKDLFAELDRQATT